MIPKSGYRFSDQIMPKQLIGDEPGSAKLDRALAGGSIPRLAG